MSARAALYEALHALEADRAAYAPPPGLASYPYALDEEYARLAEARDRRGPAIDAVAAELARIEARRAKR